MLRKHEGKISLSINSYQDLHKQLYYIGRKMHNFEYGKKVEWFLHRYTNGVPVYIQIFLNMQNLIKSMTVSNSLMPYIIIIISCIDKIIDSLSRDVSRTQRISASSVADFLRSLTSLNNCIKRNNEKAKCDPNLWANTVLNLVTLYGNNI